MRLILVALLAAAVTVPAPAAAKSPDDFSAADQYVETLPTARGPSATKERKGGKTPLPVPVAAKLHSQGGTDAGALESVATSSEFGAPHGKGDGADNKGAGDRRTSRDSAAIPSASVRAVWEDGGDLLVLLLALLAITGLMVGAVAYQRHKNSNSS